MEQNFCFQDVIFDDEGLVGGVFIFNKTSSTSKNDRILPVLPSMQQCPYTKYLWNSKQFL